MGLQIISIRVKDVKKSLKFYKSLGMKVKEKHSYMPGETVITVFSPDTKYAMRLMHYTKSCKLYAPWKEDGVELDHLSFKVPDARKTFDMLVKKGAKIAWPIREREEFKMGFVKDPNGIWVGLMSQHKKKGKK